MQPDYTEEQKYICAKNKVEELKSYYWHLAIYLIVNGFIIARKILRNLESEETLGQILSNFSTYGVAVLWGVPMLLHTFRIFGFNFMLGKDWEERKIKEFMNESDNYEKR